MYDDRQTEPGRQPEVRLEVLQLRPPGRVVVVEVETRLPDRDDFRGFGDALDLAHEGGRGPVRRVGMEPRRRPQAGRPRGQRRGLLGVLGVRGDRDHPANAPRAGPVHHLVEIGGEAVRRQMKVRIEERRPGTGHPRRARASQR